MRYGWATPEVVVAKGEKDPMPDMVKSIVELGPRERGGGVMHGRSVVGQSTHSGQSQRKAKESVNQTNLQFVVPFFINRARLEAVQEADPNAGIVHKRATC